MHGWHRSRKRLMLAVMGLPWLAAVAGSALMGALFAEHGGGDALVTATMLCFLGGLVIAYICALTCVADAAVDRRVSPPAGWVLALLLAPALAAPAYWWLHVRPGPGEPHGLEILPPARSWPARVKLATGAGALLTLVFFVAWGFWIVAFFFDVAGESVAVVMFSAFGLWTLVACAVLTLFVLDALREGGAHAALWGVLMLFAWPVAAPLYWLLYVRPTARAGGGP